jgi:hypothetical protein
MRANARHAAIAIGVDLENGRKASVVPVTPGQVTSLFARRQPIAGGSHESLAH